MAEDLNEPSLEEFHYMSNIVLNEKLSRLSERTVNLFKQRADYAKLQLELNRIYNPDNLQSVISKNENGDYRENIKSLLSQMQDISSIPMIATSTTNSDDASTAEWNSKT